MKKLDIDSLFHLFLNLVQIIFSFFFYQCTYIVYLLITAPTEVKLKLSGGSNYLEGRVEVEVYGQWGTICSSSSISSEANVICHMLGFPNGTGTTYGQFGLGGLISPGLSNIKCSGSELTIVDCLLEVALPNTVCPVVGVICDAPGMFY